ncbi:Uncharacterised protein [Candidatus Gugararchaeum adminiculabundum]|nr:Uncharacterised protein [Candidatus Gugararchaeum adminiculabundum]
MEKSAKMLVLAMLGLLILASGCTQEIEFEKKNATSAPSVPSFPNDTVASPPAMPEPAASANDSANQSPELSNGTGEIVKLHVGEKVTIGDYDVQLRDIELCQMADCPYLAAFSIYDENGVKIAERLVEPVGKENVSLQNGDILTIEVFETHSAFTSDAKWADVKISLQTIQ